MVLLHHERNLHSTWHRRKNKFVAAQLKRHSQRHLTMKKKLDQFSREVTQRLRVERRLLFTSFLDRAESRFTDTVSVPAGWNEAQPHAFKDNPKPNLHIKRVVLFASRSVNGIGIQYKRRNHVAGTVFHGHRAGARYFFELEQDEVIEALEGAVAHLVGRVRFYTNKGRRSQWYVSLLGLWKNKGVAMPRVLRAVVGFL